ncbi:hypothetical protein EIN_522550, partial [Entamoeba invadens IP1]
VVPSLRKMNLFIPLQRLVEIQDFDFKSASRVQFNLIVSYKRKSSSPDFSVFEGFKGFQNVKIYVTFLAPETLNLEFMTHFDFFCNERYKEKLMQLTVFYNLGGKSELIKNTIEKCFYDDLLVLHVGETYILKGVKDAFLADTFQKVYFDLQSCEFLKSIFLLNVNCEKLIAPKSVTKMKIYMVKGCVKFDECLLEVIKINHYSGTPLLINTDNLRVNKFESTSSSMLKFYLKGILYEEVIFTEKVQETKCWFPEPRKFKYVKENGECTVFKALCVCINRTKEFNSMYTRKLEGDVSIIPCTEFSNEGDYTTNTVAEKLKFGDGKSLKIREGKYKEIEIGNFVDFDINRAEVEILKIEKVNHFSFYNSQIEVLTAKNIDEFSGDKRFIKKLEILEK